MISGQMIQSHARLYLNGKVSLDDFEDWLLSNSWNAHLDSDSSAVEVYHKIEGSLLDFSSGAIGIDSLHEAIEQSILPLELIAPSPSVHKLVLGKPAKRAFESGSFSQPVSLILEVAR